MKVLQTSTILKHLRNQSTQASTHKLLRRTTKNGITAKICDDPDVLTDDGLVCMTVGKAPRDGLYSNQGLVELGAYQINNLRRQNKVICYAWKPISVIQEEPVKPSGPRYDRMVLALYYQSLLESGAVESRAELARYVGVSRARVTQVLRRLQD